MRPDLGPDLLEQGRVAVGRRGAHGGRSAEVGGEAARVSHRPAISRIARAHERVAAEQDRDLRLPGGRGQLAQPGIVDPDRFEQVRCESVLGRRPAQLVGSQPVRQQHPAVDDRRVAQLGQPGTERRRAVAIEEHPQDRSRGPLGGTTGKTHRRPQAALLDQGPDPAADIPFEPADCRRGRPTGDDELGPGSADHPADARQVVDDDLVSGPRIGVEPPADPAEQDQVERRVEIGGEPAAPAEGRQPRSRRAPCSQRGSALSVAKSPGSAASQSMSATARMSAENRLLVSARAGPLPPAQATNERRSACVASGIAPEPRMTRPLRGASAAAREPAWARTWATASARRLPNGRPSGGPATIRTVFAPARAKPAA